MIPDRDPRKFSNPTRAQLPLRRDRRRIWNNLPRIERPSWEAFNNNQLWRLAPEFQKKEEQTT